MSKRITAIADSNGEVIIRFPLTMRFHDLILNFVNYYKTLYTRQGGHYFSPLSENFRRGKYYINKAGKFKASKVAFG